MSPAFVPTLTRRATLGALLAAGATRARAQGAEIVVGATVPITGTFAASGVQYYNFLRMAQDDINAAGGIGGRKLRIAFEDTQATNSVAVNAFIRLARQGDIPFVFLPSLSTQDLAMEPEVLREKIPAVYAGGAVAVQERKNPWMFRIRPADNLQGPAIAAAITEVLKRKKPGILYTQDDYGLGAANALDAALTQAGIPSVAREAFAPRDNDFSAQLLSLQGKGADVIVGFTYNRDGALILSQRKRLGIDLPYIGGSATVAPSTLTLVQPGDMDGALAIADAVLGAAVSPASADFVKRYTDKWGFAPDPYGAAYYDAAMLLRDGLAAVGPDRAKLRDYLAKVDGWKGITRTFRTDAENNMAHSLTLVRFKPGTKEFEAVATFRDRHKPMPTDLRAKLARGEFFLAPGIPDMIAAVVARDLGFEAVRPPGYWMTASCYGLPDAGLVSYTQMVDRVATLAQSVGDAAVIADADTGFGGLLNVRHTVRGYEAAGAAAVQIEDQEFPKKCGHTPYRRVVPVETMVAKVRVALEARRAPERTLIIARTDSRQAEGFDGALRRAEAYADAGADIVFVEALESEEEMRRACAAIGRPMMANMADGGRTPIRSGAELAALGYACAIYPATAALAAAAAARLALSRLKATGTSKHPDVPLHDFQHFCRLIGFEDVWEFERRWHEV